MVLFFINLALKRSVSDISNSSKIEEYVPDNSTGYNSTTAHTPYPVPETSGMRYNSILVFLIFGTSYLLIKFILSSFRGSDKSFFVKAIKIIANQTLVYFICLSIFYTMFTFGLFDSVFLNWEYIIDALFVFELCWILFSLIIVSFCLLIIKKWEELEQNAKSFSNILLILESLKQKYEKIINKRYDPKESGNYVDTRSIFELYEYLILKTYFVIPFYPIFKSSTLRKDFNFAIYLRYCLLEKLRLFVKFSWTCWLLTISFIFIWNVYIAPSYSNISVFIL